MASDNQLNHLFDYTKFHIGVYMTLIGILLAVEVKDQLPGGGCLDVIIMLTIGCYMLAGAAGGAIISNIPGYQSFAEYKDASLPVLWWKKYYNL